jgi:hypothetical protein
MICTISLNSCKRCACFPFVVAIVRTVKIGRPEIEDNRGWWEAYKNDDFLM